MNKQHGIFLSVVEMIIVKIIIIISVWLQTWTPDPNFHFLKFSKEKSDTINSHSSTFRTSQLAPRSRKCRGPDPSPNIHHNITKYSVPFPWNSLYSGHSGVAIRSGLCGVALSGLGYIFENREMAERGKVSHKLQQTWPERFNPICVDICDPIF